LCLSSYTVRMSTPAKTHRLIYAGSTERPQAGTPKGIRGRQLALPTARKGRRNGRRRSVVGGSAGGQPTLQDNVAPQPRPRSRGEKRGPPKRIRWGQRTLHRRRTRRFAAQRRLRASLRGTTCIPGGEA